MRILFSNLHPTMEQRWHFMLIIHSLLFFFQLRACSFWVDEKKNKNIFHEIEILTLNNAFFFVFVFSLQFYLINNKSIVLFIDRVNVVRFSTVTFVVAFIFQTITDCNCSLYVIDPINFGKHYDAKLRNFLFQHFHYYARCTR